MPCGTLRASLPQFLHSGPAGQHCLPHSADWVLTKPGVRYTSSMLYQVKSSAIMQFSQLG